MKLIRIVTGSMILSFSSLILSNNVWAESVVSVATVQLNSADVGNFSKMRTLW